MTGPYHSREIGWVKTFDVLTCCPHWPSLESDLLFMGWQEPKMHGSVFWSPHLVPFVVGIFPRWRGPLCRCKVDPGGPPH